MHFHITCVSLKSRYLANPILSPFLNQGLRCERNRSAWLAQLRTVYKISLNRDSFKYEMILSYWNRLFFVTWNQYLYSRTLGTKMRLITYWGKQNLEFAMEMLVMKFSVQYLFPSTYNMKSRAICISCSGVLGYENRDLLQQLKIISHWTGQYKQAL